MENFPVKMQNANGLVTEALHILFATCPTCRWRFYTMVSWGHFPNTSHNKKGTATLLPPTCLGGENSSILYNKQKYFKWSNKERKWFRGFEPQFKNSHSSMQTPAKRRLGLTLPANWAVESIPSQSTPGSHSSNLTWMSHSDTAHIQLPNVIILRHKDHKTAEFLNHESELNQHGYH